MVGGGVLCRSSCSEIVNSIRVLYPHFGGAARHHVINGWVAFDSQVGGRGEGGGRLPRPSQSMPLQRNDLVACSHELALVNCSPFQRQSNSFAKFGTNINL